MICNCWQCGRDFCGNDDTLIYMLGELPNQEGILYPDLQKLSVSIFFVDFIFGNIEVCVLVKPNAGPSIHFFPMPVKLLPE